MKQSSPVTFVAFGELGDRLDLALHFLQLAGQGGGCARWLAAGSRSAWVSMSTGVVGQHAAFFQAAQAFADAGARTAR